MKRLWVLFAVLTLTACSNPEVEVNAMIEGQEGAENAPLADLPVQLLPYDRDAIFDSLAAESGEPEPETPPDLLARQSEVQEAEQEWRVAQQEWSATRRELRDLGEETTRMEQEGLRGTPQYQQAFAEFEQLEQQEVTLRQQDEAAFDRFRELQEAVLEEADSIRTVREAWEERVFADYDQAVEERLDRLGREEHFDTTNAEGVARVRVRSGDWWVHARYTLPYQELYWNVPVQVDGDGVSVMLNRENAEERLQM